jgi:ATP-dependent RNA helicase RhlE
LTFNDLNLSTPLLNALNDLGYTTPTPIQEQAFSVIMSGRDVVGLAQTGTGKTFAYLLPLLRQLKYSEQRHPRILIIVPTRELVLQVLSEIDKLTKYFTVRREGVFGASNIKTQKQLVYNGIDVLVATPGRLVDLSMSGVLRLKSIQKLVIDEVDVMFNLGFRTQITDFIESLPSKHQNLLFSATMTDDVEELITGFFNDPQKIEISQRNKPVEKIEQWAYIVPNFYTKFNLLELLLNTNNNLRKVLIYVRNKKAADLLFALMEKNFPDEVGIIHSNKSANTRLNELKRFNAGFHRVLISTDNIARGLDFQDVTHVVNFDMPTKPEHYIHRIGRTGRAGKDGAAFSFVTEAEQVLLTSIQEHMGINLKLEELPENLEFSNLLTEEELNAQMTFDKDYLKSEPKKKTAGAFHEKKEKNRKVNLGSPSRRNPLRAKPTKKYGRKKQRLKK